MTAAGSRLNCSERIYPSTSPYCDCSRRARIHTCRWIPTPVSDWATGFSNSVIPLGIVATGPRSSDSAGYCFRAGTSSLPIASSPMAIRAALLLTSRGGSWGFSALSTHREIERLFGQATAGSLGQPGAHRALVESFTTSRFIGTSGQNASGGGEDLTRQPTHGSTKATVGRSRTTSFRESIGLKDAAIARAFQNVIRDSRSVVVSILDEADRHVSCGTIVEANGLIVTIASTLPAEPRCRLAEGRVVTAQVIGMDPAFDLALLSVPLTGLPMVKWAEMPPPVTGTILAAAGMSESPLPSAS